MPYYKGSKKAYKRRLFTRSSNKPYAMSYGSYKKKMKKRKNDWPTIVKVPKSISAFPEITRVRMRWAGQLRVNPALSQADTYFQHNAVYKPYPSGATQASGWAAYSAAYQRYRVFGSSIKVSLYDVQATGQWIGIMPVPDATGTVASAIDLRQQPLAKWRIITRNDAGKPTTLKHYMSMAKLYGIPPLAVRIEKDYSALAGGVPTVNTQWLVRLQSDDGATNIDIRIMFEIDYYVEWFDRLDVFTG